MSCSSGPQEWAKLAPLIDLEAIQAAGVENRGGLTLGRRRIEHGLRSRA